MKIGVKLALSFAGLLLIPSISISIFSYRSARSSIDTQILNQANSSVNLLDTQITEYIQSHEEDLQTLTAQVNSTNSGQAIQSLLTAFQSKHPELEGSWIDPVSSSSYFHSPPLHMPKSFNPTTRPWYIEAKKSIGHPIVTTPYKSAVGSHGEVVAIAEMSKNGKYVVGTNLSLSALSTITEHVKIGSTGYAVLADTNKKYIVSPTYKAGTSVKNTHSWDVVYSHPSGKVQAQLQGQNQDFLFKTNSLTGWKIVGEMNLADESIAATPILHVTLIVLIIATALGVLWALFITRNILIPLISLVKATKKIGEGDLTEEIHIKNGDEFGLLGASFEQMRQSLRRILSEVQNASEHVAASSQELMASSDESGRAAQSIAETIQEIAAGSENQASSVTESSRVVEAMSGGIQQIAVNAQQVSTNSSESTAAVSNGQQSIRSVIEQMDLISNTVTGLSESVQKLNSHSHQIGNIVGLITNIAAQTNLLSLNASIEAARAGEYGKGFAVVADEIRKLATQSAQSAQDISDLVASIQSDTNEAVQATDSTAEAVGKGLSAVDLASQSFERIHKNVTAVAGQIQEVSEAVEEISSSSEQVTHSMNTISEFTEMTAEGTQQVSASTEEQLATMEEINAAATELARTGEELQQLIGKFRV